MEGTRDGPAPGVLALAWYRQVDPGQWAGCSIAGRWRASTGVFGLVRLGEVVVTAGQWAEATDDGKDGCEAGGRVGSSWWVRRCGGVAWAQ